MHFHEVIAITMDITSETFLQKLPMIILDACEAPIAANSMTAWNHDVGGDVNHAEFTTAVLVIGIVQRNFRRRFRGNYLAQFVKVGPETRPFYRCAKFFNRIDVRFNRQFLKFSEKRVFHQINHIDV